MSHTCEDKNKIPLEIITNLLTKLLDSKLNKLESKAKEEINIIKSISQNNESMINELQDINKKIKPHINPKKNSNTYHYINMKKNSIYSKLPNKLNTNSTILSEKNERTSFRKCYSKCKKTKTNFMRNLRCNRSEIFGNDFLNNKSINVSKILNCSKMDNKTKKSGSKKRNRDITPRLSTPGFLIRRKKKENPKFLLNNTHSIKNNNNLLNSKRYKKSCKILPILKRDQFNISKISKNDELDLLCEQTDIEDKRIYELNPEISRNMQNKKKNESQKITSLLFKKSHEDFNLNKKEENKELLTLDDSLMNDVNNDELLIFYHNKKTTKLIDDIPLTKSIFGDEANCDKDIAINIDKHNNLNTDNLNKNNYTFAERIENILDYLTKYLTFEELLKINLVNKECFKMIMHYLISKKEDLIDDTKELLSLLKKNNTELIDPNEKNNNFSLIPFEFNKHSSRAIQLLREMPFDNIFLNNKIQINNKYIILVFDLFFIALGFKKKIISFNNDVKSKWNFYKNFFEKNKTNIGYTIENKIKGKIFDKDIINSLYEYSHNYINIITPSYFQNINNDIALFVFIVKNILEHVGIIKDINNKKNVKKLYLLYNARIYINSIILQKFNKINSMISE